MTEILALLAAIWALPWFALLIILSLLCVGVGLSWLGSRRQRYTMSPDSPIVWGVFLLFIAATATGYFLQDDSLWSYIRHQVFSWETLRAVLLYVGAGLIYTVIVELPLGISRQKEDLKWKWRNFVEAPLWNHLPDWTPLGHNRKYSLAVHKHLAQPTKTFLAGDDINGRFLAALKEQVDPNQSLDNQLLEHLSLSEMLRLHLESGWKISSVRDSETYSRGYLRVNSLDPTTCLPVIAVNKGVVASLLHRYAWIWPIALLDLILGDLVEIVVRKLSNWVAKLILVCVTKPFQEMFKNALK